MSCCWKHLDSAYSEMTIGKKYRVTLWFAAPEKYRQGLENVIKNIKTYFPKIKTNHINTLNGIRIDNAFTEPAVMSARQGAVDPWPLRVEFTKVSGHSPIIIVAAAIIAVIIATMVFLKLTKREFHEAINDVASGAERTVLNPGVVLAALVMAALIFRR